MCVCVFFWPSSGKLWITALRGGHARSCSEYGGSRLIESEESPIRNTQFTRLVRLMSHYYSRVLRVRAFSLVCFPSCDQRRPAFPAARPGVEGSGACFCCSLCRRGARCVQWLLDAAGFPFAFCLLDSTVTRKNDLHDPAACYHACRCNARLAVFSLCNEHCPAHKMWP